MVAASVSARLATTAWRNCCRVCSMAYASPLNTCSPPPPPPPAPQPRPPQAHTQTRIHRNGHAAKGREGSQAPAVPAVTRPRPSLRRTTPHRANRPQHLSVASQRQAAQLASRRRRPAIPTCAAAPGGGGQTRTRTNTWARRRGTNRSSGGEGSRNPRGRGKSYCNHCISCTRCNSCGSCCDAQCGKSFLHKLRARRRHFSHKSAPH
jgi:hypothetical protein